MKVQEVDCLIIGGGPAGLAAAIEAKKQGIGQVVLLERNHELGGILQQCIHDGFGLHRFKKQLSGPQYAQTFVDQLAETDVMVYLNSMVIDIQDKVVYAVSSQHGMLVFQATTIILAMGCRERTRNQVLIFGSRPSGVMTAGAVQHYINLDGLLPGKRAVILGSGDIGLIMARRMTLEGIEVEGVYEVMPTAGGLARNIYQCLDDYQIPLHLSTTVTEIIGTKRIEAVKVAQVDEHRRIKPETERLVACDLLVLSVGLIPENELSKKAGVCLSAETKGPVVNDCFMTDVPGIFACGNVAVVFDLVDYVSMTGEMAARGAADYLKKMNRIKNLPKKQSEKSQNDSPSTIPLEHSEDISFVMPMTCQKIEQITGKKDEVLTLYLRVKQAYYQSVVCLSQENQLIHQVKQKVMRPAEMVVIQLPRSTIKEKTPITVSIQTAEGGQR